MISASPGPEWSHTVDGVEYFARLIGAPDNIGKKPVFQYGIGANDKTGAIDAPVSAPATMGLLALGIAALRLSRRNK